MARGKLSNKFPRRRLCQSSRVIRNHNRRKKASPKNKECNAARIIVSPPFCACVARAHAPPPSPEIKFIGVGRIADHNLVATLAHNADNKQESDALLQAALAVLNTPDFFRKVQPGAYHSLAAEVNVVHFTVDNDASRIYVIIASKEYPKRVVFELVSKLVQQFLAEFSAVSMTCARNGLNQRARPMFSALMDEFSELSRKDNLFRVGQELKDVTNNNNHQLKRDSEDEENDIELQQQHSAHTTEFVLLLLRYKRN